MNIVNTISNGISKYIFSFCETIHTQYDIPIEDILKIWCDQQKISYNTEFAQYVGMVKKQKKVKSTPKHKTVTDNETSDISNKTDIDIDIETEIEQSTSPCKNTLDHSSPSQSISSKSPTKNSEVNLCEYKFSKGIKKGQRCTTMTKNGAFCSKHKNKET